MHEWALLLFTVCLQIAIGGMLTLAIFYKKMNQWGEETAFKAMRIPLIVIAALSLVGLIASFAHLGTPSHALNSIRNLGSSWMSREILVTGLFIGAACVTAGLAFVQKKVHHWLLILSALIGLVDIYCMAMIYANSLVSGWNSVHTFTSFYGTAFVLGPVLVASLLAPQLKDKAQSLIKNAFYISLGGIGLQLIGVALFGSVLPEVNMIEGTNALASLADYQTTVAIRWIIEVMAVAFLGYLSIAKQEKVSFSFAYVALAVLVFAEGMSRYVFYVLGA
ncbi:MULTISPECIES: DmsC/YnfH family molybdoenzyme membrane anchor subunit [Bacillaceae]|uniref:dimethyl sulfoxide reductase anchor subunit family protein n=1 Tax=Bacillaceae TaxID=186817 RepID=UPI0023DCA873|nr:DmsC/YnfH family molybdoenzyme membrane anchor subunit [Robertmurraya sp. DFI.2.37]MDF1510848.1 dimethyl sulfoxide reductase anchor subunit [Robertmurraya sp. DFI.2.37]